MTTRPVQSVRAGKRLMRLYGVWQLDQQRLQMALQTLYGAQGAVISSETAFKVAVRANHGASATFDYDDKSGKLTFRPASVPRAHGLGKQASKKK